MSRTRPAFIGRPWWFAATLAALALAGCSATRVAYERLDWLARWQVSHYVSLTSPQRAQFEQQFDAVWQWHRSRELPALSAQLRATVAQLDAGTTTRDDIAAAMTHYADFWRRITRHLAPLACSLGPQLSEAQVSEILDGTEDDLEELRRETVALDPPDAQREALRDVEKSLRGWIGRLNAEQSAVVERWNDARPSVAREWFEYRQAWRTHLASVLQQRHEAEFCPRVSTLIADGPSLWTAEQRRAFDQSRQHWVDLFVALLPTLEPKQRQHARQRLLDLADDFDALAANGAART